MVIIETDIDRLKPYENNPRYNSQSVELVKNSIKSFGFIVPMVIDVTGVVVCGHTRLLAAKELGMKKVPCVVAEGLTDEQLAAYRLADNKVAEIATWDFDKLYKEMRDIAINIDLKAFGFDDVPPNDFNEVSAGDEQKEEKRGIYCPRCGTYVAEG